MEDRLVSLDTAILANKKGFEVESGYYYKTKSKHKPYIYIPTQSLLQKWVRENLKIHIGIYCNASGWGFVLTKLNGTVLKEIEDDVFYDEFEDALEEGLKQSLKIQL